MNIEHLLWKQKCLTSSGSVSLNSHPSPVQRMHERLCWSVRSSSKNCHSWMGPLPIRISAGNTVSEELREKSDGSSSAVIYLCSWSLAPQSCPHGISGSFREVVGRGRTCLTCRLVADPCPGVRWSMTGCWQDQGWGISLLRWDQKDKTWSMWGYLEHSWEQVISPDYLASLSHHIFPRQQVYSEFSFQTWHDLYFCVAVTT